MVLPLLDFASGYGCILLREYVVNLVKIEVICIFLKVQNSCFGATCQIQRTVRMKIYHASLKRSTSDKFYQQCTLRCVSHIHQDLDAQIPAVKYKGGKCFKG